MNATSTTPDPATLALAHSAIAEALAALRWVMSHRLDLPTALEAVRRAATTVLNYSSKVLYPPTGRGSARPATALPWPKAATLAPPPISAPSRSLNTPAPPQPGAFSVKAPRPTQAAPSAVAAPAPDPVPLSRFISDQPRPVQDLLARVGAAPPPAAARSPFTLGSPLGAQHTV